MSAPVTGLTSGLFATYKAKHTPNPYLTDPVGWVQAKTGEYLWSKQREIAEALLTHRKVAVKAGHGVGKSMSASRIGTWWVDVHPTDQTWLITTAPTWEQVSTILWQELGQAHEKADLPGQITGDCKWRIGKTMVGQGRKPSDYNQHAFQGLHRDFVLVIIDEACGVAGSIWEGAANIVTGPDCRTLAIGNPDDPNSHFADICRGAPTDGTSGMSDKGWYVIRISVFDAPFFTGEDVPEDVRRRTGSQEYIDDKRKEVGEGSALWQSKVIGEFPVDASNGVLPYSFVKANMLPREWPETTLEPVELGVDIAGSDDGDWTVIRERRGPKLGRVWRYQEKDHTMLEAYILMAIHETGATSVKLDYGGIGHGLVDRLSLLGRQGVHKATIHEINFGSKAVDSVHYVNTRAELHYSFLDLLRDQAVDLSILATEEKGDRVIADLTATNRVPDTGGRKGVESKADVSARLKRSPDDGDTVLLAYYVPPVEEGPGEIWGY